MTSIGTNAFTTCIRLTAVAVDVYNTVYASRDGLLYNKLLTTLIQCPAAKTGSISIPTSVTTIGSYAFLNCTSLTSVSIPVSVITIGDYAFYKCGSLLSASISATVASIGVGAFSDCTSLTDIAVDVTNTEYASHNGMLYNKLLKTLIQCPAGKTYSVEILPGVTSIGNGAFHSCTGLTSVSIPGSVTSIGSNAFGSCTNLLAITVDATNTAYSSLGGVVYNKAMSTLIQYPAGKVGSVSIPASVITIGENAFAGCTRLTSVIIPASVKSIGAYAFFSCTSLSSVFCFGSLTNNASSTFVDTSPTLYRLTTATGWFSRLEGCAIKIFESLDVPAGQTDSPTISPATDRVLKQGLGSAILSTASTRSGGTVVEAGELLLQNKDALGTGLLEVQTGAKATFQTGYDAVSVTSISLADTSRLELGTGKLAVAANGYTESDIRTKLIAGRNGGSWNGTNGITSTFAGGDRSIGYRVAGGALEVAYAAPGDGNLDGVFDILDIGDILSAGKFNTAEPANWAQGDVNYDNVFDIVDLADILGTGLFNEGSYLTQGSASIAAVETGTVATFDPAMVFAALAAESSSQPTTKRKSF
jgi:autotransporter-associated beta strand protein